MGGRGSTPRRVTVEEDDGVGMVKVSESVARRLLGHPEKDQSDAKSSGAPKVQAIDEDELQKLEAFYQRKIDILEHQNSELYESTKAEFQKAVDEVEQKFLKSTSSPICQDLQQQVLKCYQEHPTQTLRCSPLVQAFNECVQQQRQKILTKG